MEHNLSNQPLPNLYQVRINKFRRDDDMTFNVYAETAKEAEKKALAKYYTLFDKTEQASDTYIFCTPQLANVIF